MVSSRGWQLSNAQAPLAHVQGPAYCLPGMHLWTLLPALNPPCMLACSGPGSFSGDEGDDACDACPPGLYSNTYGSRACRACRAGTFSKGGAVSCLPCPAGFSSAPGSSSCTACRPGYFASSAGSSSCTLCPLGMQCPALATRWGLCSSRAGRSTS